MTPEPSRQEQRAERAEAALRAIADGDEPRPLGKRWRADGKYSKMDQCTHGVEMYDTCGNCIAEFALATLNDGGGNEDA